MDKADQFALSPYPGLRAFEERDQAIFFGREAQVGEVIRRLEVHHLVSVIGASGSGKSSLIRAGLLPAVRQGFLGSKDHWHLLVMKPGAEPYKHLAESIRDVISVHSDPSITSGEISALLRTGDQGLMEVFRRLKLSAESKVLLVVDQFEELFRYRQTDVTNDAKVSDEEAGDFAALLLKSCTGPLAKAWVVLTMRSDFIGDCDAFHGLPEAVSKTQFLVPRLTEDQLRESIFRPSEVRSHGFIPFTFEAGLENRILNHARNLADQLPLMQHVLMRCHQHAVARANELDCAVEIQIVEDYDKVGGIFDALSIHANEILLEFPGGEKNTLVEKVFRGLSMRGLNGESVRRPVTIKRLADESGFSPTEVISVVEPFRRADRCFLLPPVIQALTEASKIDISHESLLRQWPTLKGWCTKEADSAATFIRLLGNARLWPEKASLLQGTSLDNAIAWKAEQRPTPAWAERYGGGLDVVIKYLKESELDLDRKAKEAEDERLHELRQAQEIADVQTARAKAEAARAEAEKARASAQAASAAAQKKLAIKARIVSAFAGVVAIVAAFMAVSAINLRKEKEKQMLEFSNILDIDSEFGATDSSHAANELQRKRVVEKYAKTACDYEKREESDAKNFYLTILYKRLGDRSANDNSIVDARFSRNHSNALHYYKKALDNVEKAKNAARGELNAGARVLWAKIARNNQALLVSDVQTEPPQIRSNVILKAVTEYVEVNKVFSRKDELRDDLAKTEYLLGAAWELYPQEIPSPKEADGKNVRTIAAEKYTNALNAYKDSDEKARALAGLGRVFADYIGNDREKSASISVDYNNRALKLINEKDFPEEWARVHQSLAMALANMQEGDRVDNIKRAINAYTVAIKGFDGDKYSLDRARTEQSLAYAWSINPAGNPADNIAKAIHGYERALAVFIAKGSPLDRARTEQSLAYAWSINPAGNPADNIALAIHGYERALAVFVAKESLLDRARTEQSLAYALSINPAGNPADNIAKATPLYQSALKYFKDNRYTLDEAKTEQSLAYAWSINPAGNPADNIKEAIRFYKSALIYFRDNQYALDQARTEQSLAYAWSINPAGNPADNIAKAIPLYQSALVYFKYNQYTLDQARTEQILANAWSINPADNPAENIAQAIPLYQSALKYFKDNRYTLDEAKTEQSLADARSNISTIENINEAIAGYKRALAVFEDAKYRSQLRIDAAKAKRDLAAALLSSAEIKYTVGADNPDPITLLADALQVLDHARFPYDRAKTNEQLGLAWMNSAKSNRDALSIKNAISAFKEAANGFSEAKHPVDLNRINDRLNKAEDALKLLGTI